MKAPRASRAAAAALFAGLALCLACSATAVSLRSNGTMMNATEGEVAPGVTGHMDRYTKGLLGLLFDLNATVENTEAKGDTSVADAVDEIAAPAEPPSSEVVHEVRSVEPTPAPEPERTPAEERQFALEQRRARKREERTGPLPTAALGERIERLRPWFQDNAAFGRAASVCGNQGFRVIRGPYLQSGSSDRMVVRWRTGVRGVGVVCFGTDPEAMTETVIEDGLIWPKYASRRDVDTWDNYEAGEHMVELKGLDPLTTYYYTVSVLPSEAQSMQSLRNWVSAVKDDEVGEASDLAAAPPGRYYSFKTFPDPGTHYGDSVRVWAFGDSGWGDHKAVRVRDAMMNFTGGDWDLSLGLGDLAYLKGKDWEYQKRFFNWATEQNARVPIFTTPGNHDEFTCDMRKQTGPYFESFSNPKDGKSGGLASNHPSYYSFDYGPIHFVSVDSDRLGLEDDPGLYEWLNRDLEAASKANYTWIVAYHHQPPYSKGSHDSDAQFECFKLRSNLVPTFEKYGVDLVLAGHSHAYERSHMLDSHFGSSGEIKRNPAVVKQRWQKGPDGIDYINKAECGPNSGTMYIVTGGAAIRGGGPLNHPAMHFSQRNRGSLLLEFTEKELHMWLLGEHREDGDYAGYTKVLDEAVVRKDTCRSLT